MTGKMLDPDFIKFQGSEYPESLRQILVALVETVSRALLGCAFLNLFSRVLHVFSEAMRGATSVKGRRSQN